jgi:hypothetical protein
MANFDVMSIVIASAGTPQQLSSSLAANSFVRASGATSRVTTVQITPRSDNTGTAMYWGRSNMTRAYGDRLPKGVAKTIDFDTGAISVADIYMDADTDGDSADVVFTLE